MTDSILRSYQYYTTTTIVPFPVPPEAPDVASDLLAGETNGFAIDATTVDGGTVAVIDVGTPANNLSDVILDASSLVNASTSAKMVVHAVTPYARWSAHNLFLNSGVPATQSVTVVTGFVYTVTVTGAGGGSLTGSSGASGVATTGSPVTFTATGTTATWTLSGSLSTMQMNRGPIATPYIVTTGAIRIGIAQSYDAADEKYGILIEPGRTNLALFSDDFTNAAWTKSNMTTAKTATGPDNGTNSASTLTATAGNATALQAITSASAVRITSFWVKRRTGSGNIDLTQDNGSTWQTMTVTSDWTKVNLTGATLTDPTVGIRIVTNTDAIDVFGFQHETSGALGASVPSSTIPTVGAPGARSADSITVAVSTLPWSQTNMTIYIDGKYFSNLTNGGPWLAREDDNNRYEIYFTSSDIFMFNYDGGGIQANEDIGNITTNVRKQITFAVKANDFDGSVDGAAAVSDPTGTLTGAITTLYFGDNPLHVPVNYLIYRFVAVPYQRETVNGDLATWRYNF